MRMRIAKSPAHFCETTMRIGLFASVALPLLFPVLCRRNLSTIRYHFTPCGHIGRDGPSYDECKQYYTSINSPIVRDDALTDTLSDFVGSQSFRPPRKSLYNLTIAGAAGGKGLCNIEYGYGLIVYTNAILKATTDYLILVGQRGLGPCDSGEPDSGEHMLCKTPPEDIASCARCREDYLQWLLNQTDLDFERTLNITGGAGGGGGSSIGTPDIRLKGDVRVYGLSGGGGGSSALLDYSALRTLLPEFENSSLNDSTLYVVLLDGSASIYNPGLALNAGFRGYRIDADPPIVTAGAGGGAFSSIDYPSNQQDGRAILRREDFAQGGTHCARKDFSNIPLDLRGGDGGFGGGGGGCGGGGGGGGFTGGAVLGADNTIPGGGGYTLEYHAVPYVVSDSESALNFNKGDGYVDIVAADCGCVYECVVYEDEDQFECLCPNYTQLAPDLSDCYHRDNREVTVPNSTLGIINGYQLKLLQTGGATMIYGMNAVLKTGQRDGTCAIVFLGEDRREIVSASEPIQGSGRVTTLAKTSLNFTGGSFHLSQYFDWLPDPQIITGGILISRGNCSIEGNRMNITISLQAESLNLTALQSDDESALHAIVASNEDTVALYIAAVLQITHHLTNETDVVLTTVQLVSAVVGGIVFGIIVCLCIILVVIVVCCCRKHHTKAEWTPPEAITTRHLLKGSSTMLSNHAYSRYAVKNGSDGLVAQNQNVSVHYDSELFSTEYDVLSYEADELVTSRHPVNPSWTSPTFHTAPTNLPSPTSLRASVLESSMQIAPLFGHLAPVHDFVGYNRSRANSNVQEWQYPRSSLVYLRELGEGQFGKVLLMKTQGIAGYSDSIPVAVKTLTSQEPEVVQKFLEEAELMKKFSHPNIVAILGVCTNDVDENSAPLMILEYMPYGDLLSFLQTHKPTQKTSITEAHFFCFAIDVAKALEFLAESKFVHRDIAARNCLVGPDLVVKIADFGLARGVHNKDYYRVAGKQLLPVRTMSPESLLYGVFTTAGDVWSYGVLLWEIVTYGEVPLKGMTTESVIEEAQKQTLKHQPPLECPPVMSSLISQCHIQDPEQRPSFIDILTRLGCSLSVSQ